MIPKIVHQIYWNRLYENDFHPIVKKERDLMKNLNPEYKFILYDMKEITEFVHSHFDGNIVKVFDMFNYDIARCDLARHLLLYKYGGIYLDMKDFIKCELDKFINPTDSCILSVERYGWAESFTTQCYMVEPKHPIVKKVIEEISKM